MNIKITKNMIKDGYDQKLIYLTTNDAAAGTVCRIGDYWFYFGEQEAEDMTPEEYIKNIPEETIINQIYETLEEFKDGFKDEPDFFMDEYAYYYYYLKESIKTP